MVCIFLKDMLDFVLFNWNCPCIHSSLVLRIISVVYLSTMNDYLETLFSLQNVKLLVYIYLCKMYIHIQCNTLSLKSIYCLSYHPQTYTFYHLTKNMTIVHHYYDCFSLMHMACLPRSLVMDSGTGIHRCSNNM